LTKVRSEKPSLYVNPQGCIGRPVAVSGDRKSPSKFSSFYFFEKDTVHGKLGGVARQTVQSDPQAPD
jgi:hypothetical protein